MLNMNKDQAREIIHRWEQDKSNMYYEGLRELFTIYALIRGYQRFERDQRQTPEEDLKPEDYQQFRSLGSACLTEGDSKRLLKFIQDQKNQGIVRSMGRVLLESLVNEVLKKEKSLGHCQAAIIHLTGTCRPQELLHSFLQLIEGINASVISESLLVLMPHLQTVLQELGEQRAAGLGSVLSALQLQLSRLPVPYTVQQEEADVHGLCTCCSALAAFTRPFTEEVKRSRGTAAGGEPMRTELVKFCMRSLREPLLEAPLHRDAESPLWLFAVEIMVTLPAIRESLSGLLFFGSVRKVHSSESREARACLAYLLFVQLITMDSFPAVFSPVFVLQCNMEHINQLLSSKKESHLLKGLALLATSLEAVQDHSLPVSLLDLTSFYSVPQNLRLVLTDCPLHQLRKSALKVFQQFVDKLDAEAKHKFFRCMLKTSNHAGLEGVVVKNIRNQVERSMKPGNANDWFLGAAFLSLLGLALHLPQAAATDLLSNMDKIMESLNLLRFLLIRDEELRQDVAVWEELCQIKDEYLQTLRVCLSMSRSYYSSQLKALQEDRKQKAKEARDAARASSLVRSINVKQDKESNVSPEVQHQVLQSALVTFDLMESLIVRIEEITEEKQSRLN